MVKAQPKKKKKKLTAAKVQETVNKAIRERDGECVVRDGRHSCAGSLTASHFYSVGGNSTFRFYPPNIHTQCWSHHGIHERKQDPFFYRSWMLENYAEEMVWMKDNWYKTVRYSQPVLEDIQALAKAGELEALTEYIRSLINEA